MWLNGYCDQLGVWRSLFRPTFTLVRVIVYWIIVIAPRVVHSLFIHIVIIPLILQAPFGVLVMFASCCNNDQTAHGIIIAVLDIMALNPFTIATWFPLLAADNGPNQSDRLSRQLA
jgi:hypothetical protein